MKARERLRKRQGAMRDLIVAANARSKDPHAKVLARKPNREWAGDMPKGGVAVSASSRRRALERLALKEKCVRAKYPVFDSGQLGRISRATHPFRTRAGYYDVVMHGTPDFALPYMEKADAALIADAIRERRDYGRGPVRLLSCHTGKADKGGGCFAQRLADELGVTVTAPDGTLWIHDDGRVTVGDKPGANTGSMVQFNPRRRPLRTRSRHTRARVT